MRKQNIFTRTKISLVVASCLAASSMPAFAADSSQIDEMKKEIKALERKLEAMQADVQKTKQVQQETEAKVEQTKKVQEETRAKVEQVASSVPNLSTQIRGIPAGKGINYGKVNIQLGGFAASETAYRSNGLQSDIGSPFSKIPFATTTPAVTAAGSHTYTGPVYGVSEFRGTERQSRFSLLATAAVDPNTLISAYYELDFLSSGTTANANESNSFSPRTRHVYGAIDWLDSGFHVLAGQTWSLATMNTHGITPRNEYIPLTIDAQYVPGFAWARQWQFRMTKDWDQKYWAALSFENSQTSGLGLSAGPAAGYTNNFLIVPPGGSLFNPVTAGATATPVGMSINKYPDVIAKFAAETDYGHYEVFDLMRNFYSNYGLGAAPATTQQNTWSNAIGGGAVIPLVPKVLDFSISAMSGKGIGRYGTSGLADVTIGADGALLPTKETMYLTGVVWHADPKWDVYANYGKEQLTSTTYANGAGLGGYGDGIGAAGTINGLKSVGQGTAGFWWSFYKGDYGRAAFSVQYSHTKLDSFGNAAGVSYNTTDNMVFTSLRYFPF